MKYGALIACDTKDEVKLHEIHLKKTGKVYWGSRFYVKSQNFEYPFNAYIWIKQIGICYKFVIDSIESEEKTIVPKYQKFICRHYHETKKKSYHKTWWLVREIKQIEKIELDTIKKHDGEKLNPDFPSHSYTRIIDNIKPKIINNSKKIYIKETKIIEYIHQSIEKYFHEVKDTPFILLTEADLRSSLYMKIFKYRKIFREPLYDRGQTNTKTIILHTEYRYGENEGYYDIAVLNPNRFNEEYYLKDKPILVGFELKLKEGCNLNNAYDLIENDSKAFNNKEDKNFAEYGFVIFVNVVNEGYENTKNELKEFDTKIKSLKIEKNLKKIFFYYIEISDGYKPDLKIIIR